MLAGFDHWPDVAMRNFFPSTEQLLETDQFILFSQHRVVADRHKYLWDFSEVAHLFEHAQQPLLTARNPDLVALELKDDSLLPDSAEKISLRSLLFNSEQALLTVGKANQILEWFRAHRHCGYCGRLTICGEQELLMECRSCNHHFFPRINPCVIVLVIKEDKMLLARNARYRSGFLSCLAGFIEVGESAEDTVLREVKEESGLDVHNIRYFKSQSWPFPSQLMLGFYADYKAGEIVPEVGEIAEAGWYSVDSLPTTPSARISVAGELIDNFVRQMQSGVL